jgi:D-hydroxyproline dehydrogenase subunit gamma
MSARFVRLAETARPTVTIVVDGRPVEAMQGDTLLVAMLCAGGRLRNSEFGDGARAGFCLMGACQDCWVWTAEGERVRACSVPVSEGVSVSTQQPESSWSAIA